MYVPTPLEGGGGVKNHGSLIQAPSLSGETMVHVLHYYYGLEYTPMLGTISCVKAIPEYCA